MQYIFLIFKICLVITTITLIIIEISKLYKPIFKKDRVNKKIVLIIIPIKLSYMAFLAWLVASNNDANGLSNE